MKSLVVSLSVAFAFLCENPRPAHAARQKPSFVGEVIIVGNTITQDRVIRRALVDINPGQVLRPRQLRMAERRLGRLGLFKVDPGQGVRPTVRALQSPGSFKDILVRVEEASTRQWKVEPWLNAVGQPVLRLMMEDHNFDPFRLPASLADITEDRAFRGGGQRAQVELARLHLVQGRLEFFADGSLGRAMLSSWFDVPILGKR
jgi:outer membrane protein assembly factor BamA